MAGGAQGGGPQGWRAAAAAAGCLAALAVRAAVALHPYSGRAAPPRFGDFEAQRHWMEVAAALPPAAWYAGAPPANDLSYWGLDYPPLSAYQAWAHGRLLRAVAPQVVALGSSRGHESPLATLLLRLSVLHADACVFFPAALACAAVFGGAAPRRRAAITAALLLSPALVIIDHGHFQYNCVSLGLAAGAAAAAGAGRGAAAAALFCAAVSHKQMALYYAPAFAAHLLGRCLQRRRPAAAAAAAARLAAAAALTLAAVWGPFLGSRAALAAVLRRVFPVHRGLYEDYVANFWCVTSPAVKWRRALGERAQVGACAAATLAALLPSAAMEAARPSKLGLRLCLSISALSFFLFSYHVHEKSVLLPLLPLATLTGADPLREWAPLAGLFSMYPLLQRDALQGAYAGLVLLAAGATFVARALCGGEPRGGEDAPAPAPAARLVPPVWAAGAAAIHAAGLALAPPARYPFLFDAAVVSWSFLYFAALLASLYRSHWIVYARQGKKKRR